MNRRGPDRHKMRYASARERAEQHERQFESTQVRIPKGTEGFRFTVAKVYRLDVIPYEVKRGRDQPGGNPYAAAGFLHYERTFYSHRIPTPEGDRYYCCLIKTFKERRCPICEYLAQGQRTGTVDDKLYDNLKAKERQLFNVIDLDEKDKGVQIFEFNFWEFGRVLDEKVRAKEKYETFYCLQGGRTIEVTVKADHTFQTARFKPFNIEFEDRDDYPEEVLDQTLDLDSLLKQVTYEELKQVFLEPTLSGEITKEDEDEMAESKEEEEEETSPQSLERKARIRKPEDHNHQPSPWHEEDMVIYKGKEMEIRKVNRDGTLKLEWQNPDPKGEDRTFDNVDPDQVRDDVPSATKNRVQPDADDADEEELDAGDDFDEQEEEVIEEPKPPQRRRSS